MTTRGEKTMKYRQISKALTLSNAPFATEYNGHKIEFNKPDVRNRHNVYWWVEIDGKTVLTKGTASAALEIVRNICD